MAPEETNGYLPDNDVQSAAQIERQELLGFRRTLRRIEWLLSVLMGLYLFIPHAFYQGRNIILVGIACYIVFILWIELAFRFEKNIHAIISAEIFGMICFITLMLWQTGMIESPLLSLYFFPIIASAISLPARSTYTVSFITALCLLMAVPNNEFAALSQKKLISSVILLSSFWLVSYFASRQSSYMIAARQKIQQLSETDYLTGLNNMRTFMSLARREYERSIRHGYPFAVLMIDADNLKPINDTYGHEYGSTMIKRLAESINRNLRGPDISARYGGDEFVVLLTETDRVRAMLAAERLRLDVEQLPLHVPDGVRTITVSIGIACFPDHGVRVEELITRADEALYKSKHEGRNRATTADSL